MVIKDEIGDQVQRFALPCMSERMMVRNPFAGFIN